MKVGGFVLDVDTARDRVWRWAREGRISRVGIQADHWPHAEKNRADFARWRQELEPLGVTVGLTMWCGDNPQDVPGRIEELRAAHHPPEWWFNMESPPKVWEGTDCTPIAKAFRPDRLLVSYNLVASRGAFDFRHFALINGAEFHGQSYNPDGDSNVGPFPSEHVEGIFSPAYAWAGGGGPAWWYRVRIASSWGWRQMTSFDGKAIQLVRADGKLPVWADGHEEGGLIRFSDERVVRNASGAAVGKVYGFAPYHRVGYSVGTTRPVAPEKLQELARAARAPGMPLVKKVTVYCFENTSDEQIRALNEAV